MLLVVVFVLVVYQQFRFSPHICVSVVVYLQLLCCVVCIVMLYGFVLPIPSIGFVMYATFSVWFM